MAPTASSCCHPMRQVVETGLLWRPCPQARMRAPAIVEIQIQAEQRARIAYAVMGPQIDLLVPYRTPEPLHKHVVPLGAAAIQVDRDRLILPQPSERHAAKLAALVGVGIIGLPWQASASFTASRQNSVSSAVDSRHAKARRFNQSITATG